MQDDVREFLELYHAADEDVRVLVLNILKESSRIHEHPDQPSEID